MKEVFKFTFDISDPKFININGKITSDAIVVSALEAKEVYTNESWYLSKKDLIELGLPNVENQTFTLQDKTLYRFPKLDLPRQKVDLIKEKFNCKVIRDASKADIHVISSKFFNSLFTKYYRASISVSEMFKMFKTLKEEYDLFTDDALKSINSFISSLPKDAAIVYNCNAGWNRPSHVDNVYIILNCYESDILRMDNYSKNNWHLLKENYKAYNDIITSTSTLVLDTDICDIIDEDLAVLDNDQYGEIEKMVKNNDIDNRSLALEMLANCNLNKSFDVVSGLYYWNFEWLKNTTNWQTANVKTFRKRMSAYDGDHGTQSIHSYDRYIKRLIEDDRLTDFALTKTKEKLYNEFLKNTLGPSSSVFKIDLESIHLKKELNN